MRKELHTDVLMRRGARPTRAGPWPVRKLLPALRLATGRRGRTRAGPRGVVSKWSGRASSLGSARWRTVQRTRPWYAGSVGSLVRAGGFVVGVYTDRPGGPVRDYRSRRARWQSTVTTGTPHVVEPALRGKTRPYKLCEIGPRRRWRDGFVRVFWRSQQLPPKPRPMAVRGWSPRADSSRWRGEKPQWKEARRRRIPIPAKPDRTYPLDIQSAPSWPRRMSHVEATSRVRHRAREVTSSRWSESRSASGSMGRGAAPSARILATYGR